MNILHFADIVGLLGMESMSENPRESIKCFLEEPWLCVHIVQRLLVFVVKLRPRNRFKLLLDSTGQREAPIPEILIFVLKI